MVRYVTYDSDKKKFIAHDPNVDFCIRDKKLYIKIVETWYLAAALVLLSENHFWPEDFVIWKDGNTLNIDPENLEEGFGHCPKEKIPEIHRVSGIQGITYTDQRDKWNARIYMNGKTVNLGYYTRKYGAALMHYKAQLEKGSVCEKPYSAYSYLKYKGFVE